MKPLPFLLLVAAPATARAAPVHRLAFTVKDAKGQGTIYIAKLDGSGQRRVTSTVEHGLGKWLPKLTPDGRGLFYSAGPVKPMEVGPALTLLDLRTGKPRQLIDFGPGGQVATAAFNPDGRRVVVWHTTKKGSKDQSLTLIDIKTGRRTELPTHFHNLWSAPLWSPDGRTLIYADSPSGPDGAQFFRADLTGKAAVPLGHGQFHTIYAAIFSANSRELFFATGEAQQSIASLNLATGATRTITKLRNGQFNELFADPDGRTLYLSTERDLAPRDNGESFNTRRSDLTAIDLATGHTHSILKMTGLASNFAFSPGTRKIFFQWSRGTAKTKLTTPMSMDVDGKNRKELSKQDIDDDLSVS